MVTVIEVNRGSVKIRFDDRGYIKQTTTYYLRSGSVAMPTYLVGDIILDKTGKPATILAINGTKSITFQWEDGSMRVLQSSCIKLGYLMKEEDSSKLNPKIKVGDTFTNFQGSVCEVIKYEKSSKVTVRFSEHITYDVVTSQGNLKAGHVHNKYLPTLFGVGVFGDYTGGVKSIAYKA